MAYQIPDGVHSLEAAADLSASQFTFVTLGATGIDLAGAAARIDGVVVNNPALGEVGAVQTGGIAKVVASAAIAVGASVGAAASGQARTAVSLDYIAGVCVEAAGAAGELCSVLLTFPGKQA